MQIIYSPIFLRQYRKLELDIQKSAEMKEGIFRKNPFDTRLKTHKLHGRLSDLWAFSVTNKYRIVFCHFLPPKFTLLSFLIALNNQK